jgi:hypothetical protein
VSLMNVVLNGEYNEDGTTLCEDDKVANAIDYQRELVLFFETGANRQFDLTFKYEKGAVTREFTGSATFEQFGQWRAPVEWIWITSMLITIADGLLVESS